MSSILPSVSQNIKLNAYTSGASKLLNVPILVDVVAFIENDETAEALQLILDDNYVTTNDLGGLSNSVFFIQLEPQVAAAKEQNLLREW